MKKTLLLLAVVLMSLGMMAQTTTYTKVASTSELSAGDKVLLVGFDDNGVAYAMSYQKTNNRHAVVVDIVDDAITTTVAATTSDQTSPYEMTIGIDGSDFTFFDAVKNGYLYAAGGGNNLKIQQTLSDQGKWDIAVSGDGFVPTSEGNVEQNLMRYNSTSTLFSCYKSSSSIQGLIYIFKGGEPVADPEPSNYPTNFAVALDITKAITSWTASTGAQLPRGYVVIGSTGNITVPVDGTPVENDIDPSDGLLAYNTTGTSVYFDLLPPNTTWHFAIFPYTNSGAMIDYKNDGTYPTATLTTDDVTCIYASNFAAGLEPFNAINITGDQVWGTGSNAGVYFAKMTGHTGGTPGENFDNEDWLISSNIIQAGQVYDMLTIAFRNCYKFDGDALKCYYSTDYNGIDDPYDGFTWNDITNHFVWSSGDYVWASTNYTMNTEGMTNLYVAFKYTSNTETASTWEIADFKVYSGYDAVEELEAVTFNIYPNPASDVISINAENDAMIQIFDMAGRVVMNANVNEGINTISVAELADGIYFVRMNGAVVKFVKR